MANKATLENELRNQVLDVIRKALEEHFDTDILDTSASEIVMPCVDSEGNEKYAKIKVSIPRGTRSDGGYIPYNGYDESKDWSFTKTEREERAKASKEKKERAEAERERKRAAKQTIKKMKAEIQEVLPTVSAEVTNS